MTGVGEGMANVTIREWVQNEWIQPGVDLLHNRGDFYDVSGLYPDLHREALKRSPAWSAHTAHTGLLDVKGLFYDHTNSRYVMLGSNAADNFASAYFNTSWSLSGISELSVAFDTLGGQSQRNYLYAGGYLYVIADTRDVYRVSGYTNTLNSFYATSDADLLAFGHDRVWMITQDGTIYRLNDADGAFEEYLDPVVNFEALYAMPYRGYMAVVGQHRAGRVSVYRVAPTGATSLQEIASIELASPNPPTTGSLFALHDDRIFFSPGPRLEPDNTWTTDVYAFNGSQLKRVSQIRSSGAATASVGLLTWRGLLIYYNLQGNVEQEFKMLVGSHFIDFAPAATMNCSSMTPFAVAVATELIATAQDGSSNLGIHYMGDDTFSDGYLVTSRLDMHHPGVEKRLLRVTVMLDDLADGFKINIKYRVNDETSWTTAESALNNSRRAVADGLSVSFYTLQLQVELDDDTGNDEDIRIVAVSIIYSIGRA